MVLGDDEYREIEEIARRRRLTVSEWVRQTLRYAGRREPLAASERKLAALKAALRHEFPTGDIDDVLAQIESGYGGGS